MTIDLELRRGLAQGEGSAQPSVPGRGRLHRLVKVVFNTPPTPLLRVETYV
jgi:hypothetical protein